MVIKGQLVEKKLMNGTEIPRRKKYVVEVKKLKKMRNVIFYIDFLSTHVCILAFVFKHLHSVIGIRHLCCILITLYSLETYL